MPIKRRSFLTFAGAAAVQSAMPRPVAAAFASAPVRVVPPLKDAKNVFRYAADRFRVNGGFSSDWGYSLIDGNFKYKEAVRFDPFIAGDDGSALGGHTPGMVVSFIRETALLEHIALFPDQTIREFREALIANQVDTRHTWNPHFYESISIEPEDYKKIMNEKSVHADLLHALESCARVQNYIKESRARFDKIMRALSPGVGVTYTPVRAEHISVSFHSSRNTYFELKQAGKNPLEAFDWTDEKSVNFLIENEFFRRHGVRLKKYDIDPGIAGIFDRGTNSVLQRYVEYRNRRMRDVEAPYLEAAGTLPIRPCTPQEEADFRKNAEAYEGCLNALAEDHSFKPFCFSSDMLQSDLYERHMAPLKKEKPAKKRKRGVVIETVTDTSAHAPKTTLEDCVLRRALVTVAQATVRLAEVTKGDNAQQQAALPQTATPALEYKPGMPMDSVQAGIKQIVPALPILVP